VGGLQAGGCRLEGVLGKVCGGSRGDGGVRGDQRGWPGCAANTQTPQARDGRIGHTGMLTTCNETGASTSTRVDASRRVGSSRPSLETPLGARPLGRFTECNQRWQFGDVGYGYGCARWSGLPKAHRGVSRNPPLRTMRTELSRRMGVMRAGTRAPHLRWLTVRRDSEPAHTAATRSARMIWAAIE
jgi:hypothetical protein